MRDELYVIDILIKYYGVDEEAICVDGGFHWQFYIYLDYIYEDFEYLIYAKELTKENILEELDMYLDKKYMGYRNAQKRENTIRDILK